MNRIPQTLRGRRALVALLLVVCSSILVSSVAFGRTAPAAQAAPAAPAAHSAPAADGSLVKIDLWGEVKRGADVVRLDDSTRVTPGEEIIWKVRLVNRRQTPISGVMAVGDIPQGTNFVPGSAVGQGVTAVEYSIDGGKTYSAQPVVMKDGKPVPAPVSSYTQIRLTFGERVDAGAVKMASYRTRVL